MKYIILSIFCINFLVPQNSNEIYYGKSGALSLYFENPLNDNVLIEIGGSSMKYGGEHVLLNKTVNEKNEVSFVNKTKNVILNKDKKASYVLIYESRFGQKKIVFKLATYNDNLDKMRQNTFRMVYKKYKRINVFEEFLKEFNKFKSNPVNYRE
jgi:hypothetical protein